MGLLAASRVSFLPFSGPITAGDHTITWEVFQVGTDTTSSNSNPFGLLYTGSYEQREVVDAPEPVTLSLMGSGLIALGFFARRFRKRSDARGKVAA